MVWMCINAQLDKARGTLSYPRKYFTTEGCNYTFPAVTKDILINDLSENITDNRYFARYPLISPISLKVISNNFYFLLFGSLK